MELVQVIGRSVTVQNTRRPGVEIPRAGGRSLETQRRTPRRARAWTKKWKRSHIPTFSGYSVRREQKIPDHAAAEPNSRRHILPLPGRTARRSLPSPRRRCATAAVVAVPKPIPVLHSRKRTRGERRPRGSQDPGHALPSRGERRRYQPTPTAGASPS